MKVLSLFSEIGAFEKALKSIGIPFELVGYCEIDKYASKSYSAIHDVSESMNFGDITKIDEKVDEKFYLSNVQIKKLFMNSNTALVYDRSMIGFEGSAREYNDIMPTLTSREWKEPRVVNENRLAEINMLGLLDIKGNEQVRRVYGTDGVSPTLNTMQGGNRQPKIMVEPCIQRVDIPQTVKVRKYPVDTKKLCETLRKAKKDSCKTNYEIAEELDVTVTKVEHWFRQDGCFSIPEPELWFKLKSFLGIETNEFDESIMTFVEKEGVFEKSERHYLAEGIAPTLTSTTADEKIIEPNLRIRKLTPKECFRLMGFTDEDFEKAEAVNSNTQLYKQAGNSIVVNVLAHIFTNLRSVSE